MYKIVVLLQLVLTLELITNSVAIRPIEDDIKTVRDNVVRYFDRNPYAAHPNDLERVKTKDFFIERYLKDYNRNRIAAENAIIRSLTYFSKEGFNDLNKTYFPSEVYSIGLAETVGRSLRREPILSSLTRCWRLFFVYGPEYTQMITVFLQILNDVDNYLQTTRMSYFIVDLDVVLQLTIRIFFDIVKPSVGRKLKYVRTRDLSLFVNLDTFPVRAGGNNNTVPRIPEGVKSGKCLPQFRTIPSYVWDAFRQQNHQCIREGMVESGVLDVEKYLRYTC